MFRLSRFETGHFRNGWVLDEPTSDNRAREFTQRIDFDLPFRSSMDIPKVQLGVSAFDIRTSDNTQRLDVQAINIDRAGFTLSVKTWNKCQVYAVSGMYIALQPVIETSLIRDAGTLGLERRNEP